MTDEKKKDVRVRFPPSPTGLLHIGGLRTALYNYLFARRHQGVFVLRIEDTDRARMVDGGAENIIRTLDRSGILHDEGPFIQDGEIVDRGNLGPYTQSQRLPIYAEHLEMLLNGGFAYRCDCSSERLDEVRKEQQKAKLPTGYDRHCRERKDIDASAPHAVRFAMPREGESTYTDIIRDEVKIKNALVDDFVLMKTDGYPTYHLASVVDDHLMKISHVIRGEEWISSMPKHLSLYNAFGWEIPEFAHLPLLLNPDRSKLSKRQGDVAAEDFLDKGYLAEALVNFVALLGWNPEADREIYTLKELIDAFDLSKVNSAGGVFNREKLDWMNGKYLRALSPEEFAEKAAPFLVNAQLLTREEDGWVSASTGEHLDAAALGKILAPEQGRVKTLGELPEAVAFMFTEKLDYDSTMLIWKKSDKAETLSRIEGLLDEIDSIEEGVWNEKALEEHLMTWIKEKGWSNGDTLWPLRVALSGSERSPGPFELMAILGKMKVVERLEDARKRL